LSRQSMLEFASVLRRKPPSLIYGHAHNMYIFAKFLEKERIFDIRPKGMYSAGMVLHDWERTKVEEIFQCKFQDRYGCEELGLIAAECKKQEGLHINTDDLYVEFLNKSGDPVDPGTPGHIVITDLSNYVMPFIRYRIEDIGIPSDRKCSCGRTQPLIEKIQGRVADFIITPEGRCISGISLTDHFGASIPGVAQMQIVQKEVNLLTLNIVKGAEFDKNSLSTIQNLVRTFFGKNMKFDCNFVENIPQEASGKYRFTICNINNPFL
jgi:phenylacetate-CoA ligase